MLQKYHESGFVHLVNPLKDRILTLKEEYKKKILFLEKKRELRWDIKGPVATALVLSEKGIQNEKMKKKVELSGMETVFAYERDHARVPRDVSQYLCGYDIESVGHHCIRYIEVKAFKRSGTITMTEHEWRTAGELQDNYYLYVVENALNNFVLTIVRDPYSKLADSAERVPKESFEIKIKHIPGDVISFRE